MSEQTAQFLARLSHQWELPLLLLPILFGAAMYITGKWLARTKQKANPQAVRWLERIRVGLVGLLCASIITLFVGGSHLGCATLKANSATCMSHLRQVALGVAMYAQDYDERLPPASRWAEVIAPQLKEAAHDKRPGEDIFRCPSAESPSAYGMNEVMGSVQYADIDILPRPCCSSRPMRPCAPSRGEPRRQRNYVTEARRT